MDELTGEWRVERISGLLPPVGIGKSIRGLTGVTTICGVPTAGFTREGNTLDYRRLPIQDKLSIDADGRITGAGLLFGRLRFCRFRLVPRTRSSTQTV